jgi:hypothetical protein
MLTARGMRTRRAAGTIRTSAKYAAKLKETWSGYSRPAGTTTPARIWSIISGGWPGRLGDCFRLDLLAARARDGGSQIHWAFGGDGEARAQLAQRRVHRLAAAVGSQSPGGQVVGRGPCVADDDRHVVRGDTPKTCCQCPQAGSG